MQLAPMVYQRRASGEIAGVESAYRIDDSGAIRLKLGGYNPDDQLLIDPVIAYNTYLAGSATDAAREIGHDSHGFIYLAGYTDSTDFVQAGDSYNISNSGNRDIWVMKLNLSSPPDQVVVCSTYLGGAADEMASPRTRIAALIARISSGREATAASTTRNNTGRT